MRNVVYMHKGTHNTHALTYHFVYHKVDVDSDNDQCHNPDHNRPHSVCMCVRGLLVWYVHFCGCINVHRVFKFSHDFFARGSVEEREQ